MRDIRHLAWLIGGMVWCFAVVDYRGLIESWYWFRIQLGYSGTHTGRVRNSLVLLLREATGYLVVLVAVYLFAVFLRWSSEQI
ncbi:hypothetical protein LCGC14_0831630 [marine sediment metagenome]|uniref:Uncharacterized protein n=1 Tax=marine sediment metagenome TaxID=412755 RepID=A0A0F9PKD3_9ZZZZ